MMRFVFLALIVLALIYEKINNSEEIAGSKNFHISDGLSKSTYLTMRAGKVDAKSLKKFVELEDRFLQIEQDSVCSGIPNYAEGAMVSTAIKEMFPKYNFAYHTIHLKQMGEPLKFVNPKIKCT